MFKDKVVAVTGAGSGIGAAICQKFAQNGARVALIDMDADAARERADRLVAGGSQAAWFACDVSRRAECETAIGSVIETYGGIDVLVNNAGITQRSAFVKTRPSVYRRVMDVNFFGSLYCTKAAIDSLIERRGMIIVNESVAGFAPLIGRSGYSASKHALHGFFATVRGELRTHGVHVMIVCPGFVDTNLQLRALGGDGQVTAHPQSRVGKQQTPAQIADHVYRGALQKKNLLVISAVGKLSYWMMRLAPALYERIMMHQLKEELNEGSGSV